jgi:hypothetical protein
MAEHLVRREWFVGGLANTGDENIVKEAENIRARQVRSMEGGALSIWERPFLSIGGLSNCVGDEGLRRRASKFKLNYVNLIRNKRTPKRLRRKT